jgi:capsular exopolysaccharide synthesis family protein
MSKLFDAVRKNSVINFGEICQVDANNVNGLEASEQPAPAPRPVSSIPKSNRVVRLRASALSPVFPFDEAQSLAAEQYRMIRTKLLHSPQKPQLVVVSSVSSGDGKTITSINIAGSLALKSDSRILLIDGDLRHPRIAGELDIPISPGLTDVLSGAVEFETAVIRAEQFPNLFILPAGSPTANAAELLESSRWRELLKQVRARFANVIFDAPPMAAVTDYELLQLGCDGVVLVVRPDHSNRAACIKALKTVPEGKLMGVVLNCVEDWWLWKTPTYGYYRSYSGQPFEAGKDSERKESMMAWTPES